MVNARFLVLELGFQGYAVFSNGPHVFGPTIYSKSADETPGDSRSQEILRHLTTRDSGIVAERFTSPRRDWWIETKITGLRLCSGFPP
jgi:hypothetical protein